MIDSIQLDNFKSIAAMKIKLAPLTILVGPNGSGKTSILESIALMAQTSRISGALGGSLKGEFVDFEDEKAIRCKGSESARLKLGFSASVDIRPLLAALRSDAGRKGMARTPAGKVIPSPMTEWLENLSTVLHNQTRNHDFDLSTKKHLQDKTAHRSIPETLVEYQFAKDFRSEYRFHRYEIAGMFVTYERDSSFIKTSIGGIKGGKEVRVNERISPAFAVGGTAALFDIGGEEAFMPVIGSYSFFFVLRNELVTKMHDVYYLSAQRGHIPWTVDTSQAGGVAWVGSKGEHTLEVLSQLMKPENREKWLPYGILLEKFGVKRAWSGWKEKGVLYSNYVDPLLGSSHKLPSLGFGAKQLIPIVIQLAYCNPGSTVLVEEPETSLHPAHQTLLPILFANAVGEGKQVIVTTHSSFFPLSLYQIFEGVQLRRLTEEGTRSFHIQLNVDDVAVYQIFRGKNGLTQTRLLELDKDGLKEGIPSFIEVERKILDRYLRRE